MTRKDAVTGFIAAVLSSALAGLIVWGVTGYFSDGGPGDGPTNGSAGDDPQRVPQVVGQSLEDAMRLLVGMEYRPVEAERRISGEHPVGSVVEQRPPADHLAAAGATVELVVEVESIAVPELIGARIEQAIQRLAEAGLAVGGAAVRPPQAESTGRVIDQDPGPADRVLPGTTVAMVLEGVRPEPPESDEGSVGDGSPPTAVLPDRRVLENIVIRRPRIIQPQGQPRTLQLRLRVPPTPEPIAPADNATLSRFPRRTTLRWEPVEQAETYSVEVDVKSGDRWLSEAGKSYILKPGLTSTRFTFEFLGAQPGRWRVWAVNNQGIASPKSAWQQFRYTR